MNKLFLFRLLNLSSLSVCNVSKTESQSRTTKKPFFSLPATAFTILPFTVFIKSPLIAQSHNFRSVRSYCNSMFKMSRELSVSSDGSPFVIKNTHIAPALVHHGFNGNSHTRNKPHSSVSSAVIGYAWVFVQFRTYAVADKISYHRVTASFDILLNSVAYVTTRLKARACLIPSYRLSFVASSKACASALILPQGNVKALSP